LTPAGYKNIVDSNHFFYDFEAIVNDRIIKIDTLKRSNLILEKTARPLPRQDSPSSGFDLSAGDTLTTWESLSLTRGQLKKMRRQLRRLQRSTVHYRLFDTVDVEKGNGYTFANLATGEIELAFGRNTPHSDEVVVHELQHAVQYEKGWISFGRDRNDSLASLNDVTDEIKAYSFAKVIKYNIRDAAPIGIDSLYKINAVYRHLPVHSITIHSPEGRRLRAATVNAGKANEDNPEFYKNWEKDFIKGCKLLVDSLGHPPASGPCQAVLRRPAPAP
jgi:hypothetical protein